MAVSVVVVVVVADVVFWCVWSFGINKRCLKFAASALHLTTPRIHESNVKRKKCACVTYFVLGDDPICSRYAYDNLGWD